MSTPPAADSSKTSSSAGASAVEFEPPLACVRRILKNSLPSSNVGKDASAAFARACGIFVIYVTACANDFARENKRQTITANDVLAAVKELDFDEFTPELKEFLEAYRASEKSKKEAKSKASSGKAKAVEEAGDDAENDGTYIKSEGSSPPAKKARLHEPSPTVSSPAENDTASDEEDADHEHDKDDEANDQAQDDDAGGKEEEEEIAGQESMED